MKFVKTRCKDGFCLDRECELSLVVDKDSSLDFWTMLVSVVLLLSSCGWTAGLGSDANPPAISQRQPRHTGLLNLALRGGYLPPPGASPHPQRPTGQYLAPANPHQRPTNSYLPPPTAPVTAVTGHSPSQQRPPVTGHSPSQQRSPVVTVTGHSPSQQRRPVTDHSLSRQRPSVTGYTSSQQLSPVVTVTGHSQPPVWAQQQPQPWIPIITAPEHRAETARPAGPGSQQPAPSHAKQTQTNSQNFHQGHVSPHSISQNDHRQKTQQTHVVLQPAPQRDSHLVSQKNVQVAPQRDSHLVSQKNVQQAPVFLQPAPQNNPKQASQNVQQDHVFLSPNPQKTHPQISQELFNGFPQQVTQGQPRPQDQPTVQESRPSSEVILQKPPASQRGQSLPPSQLDFQYLPPPSTDIRTELRTPGDPSTGGAGPSPLVSGLPPPSQIEPGLGGRSGTNGAGTGQAGSAPAVLRDSQPASHQISAVKVVSVAGQERERPLVVYFEGMHFRNKATEPGFCQSICASPSQVIGTSRPRHSAARAVRVL